MADIKILDLTTATEVTETTDYIPIVDTSDTTQDSTGTTKKATVRKLLGDRVLPDTIVGTTETQTLTNKTIDGDNNTLQDINPASIKGGLDGWIPAGETWTYASATTFTISGDKTGKYQKEDKIKLTQTTAKYFRITNISYSSPNTTVTVDGFGIYTLANATITSPYYSKIDNPQGFPQKEVLLFSGTPAASITLSETSDHFDILDIWYEGNNAGGIAGIPYYYTRFDTAIDGMFAPAVDMGGIDSVYKIRTSGAFITRSGTKLSITGSGTNYSTDTKSDNTVTFFDVKFIPKITRVRGIRW